MLRFPLTTFVWNISHPKKNWARYNSKCTCLQVSTRYLVGFSWNLIFSYIFGKYSYSNFHFTMHFVLKCIISDQLAGDSNFHANPSSGFSWKSVQWKPGCSMRADEQANEQDEANSRFSQICARAWKATRQFLKLRSSGLWRRVVWMTSNNVSYKHDACIFRYGPLILTPLLPWRWRLSLPPKTTVVVPTY